MLGEKRRKYILCLHVVEEEEVLFLHVYTISLYYDACLGTTLLLWDSELCV